LHWERLAEEYDAWAREPENKRMLEEQAATRNAAVAFRTRFIEIARCSRLNAAASAWIKRAFEDPVMQQTWMQPNNAQAQEEAVQASAAEFMAGR
jgi:hypothetical protein